MNYEITITNVESKPLDKNFRDGADDVNWSVTVDDTEYTGKLIYNKVKDDYEVEPDGDMPEQWEDVEDAITKKFTEEIHRANTGNPAVNELTWCDCEPTDDPQVTYYDDNACECGIAKHHYHCNKCKKIYQIG